MTIKNECPFCGAPLVWTLDADEAMLSCTEEGDMILRASHRMVAATLQGENDLLILEERVDTE